jgi:hypothetical protein
VVVRTKGDKQVAFKQQGMRWCVEAQTKDDGVVEVACQDVKHSIAIYGCFQVRVWLIFSGWYMCVHKNIRKRDRKDDMTVKKIGDKCDVCTLMYHLLVV